MWFADVICDFDWFIGCQGDLGTPRARVRTHACNKPELELELLLYGGEFAVRHLRVLFHTDRKDVVDGCLDDNIMLWIHSLEASSAMGSSQPCSVAIFPLTTSFAVITGQGDESAKAVTMSLNAAPQPADYKSIAAGLVNWEPKARTYLFYLVRFLNPSLPPDARWLNGYRLIEWHFMQGKDGLAGNAAWRALLEEHRAKLQPHLRSHQTLHGLLEEARALAAHAILDNRTDAERAKKPGDLITWTFATLEALIIGIMNEPGLSRGLIKVQPRISIH